MKSIAFLGLLVLVGTVAFVKADCSPECAVEKCSITHEEIRRAMDDPDEMMKLDTEDKRNKFNCLKRECECPFLLAASNAASEFNECYEEEAEKCGQTKNMWERTSCQATVFAMCQDKTTLVSDFGCDKELTNEECLDLYTIAQFRGKLSDETLLMRVQPENKDSMIAFMKVLDAVPTELHHGEHNDSPISKDGGDWDYEMSTDPLAI